MTARSACSRGPRGALHVHPFRVDLNTHERTHGTRFCILPYIYMQYISRDRRVLLPPLFFIYHITVHTHHAFMPQPSAAVWSMPLCRVLWFFVFNKLLSQKQKIYMRL